MAFLPRSKCLLISWLQSPFSVILEPKKIKSVTVSIISPSICHEVIRPDAMIFIFWMLSFKPTFSLSSFTFIKGLFSFSLLSAIMVVSSAYLRLLLFLPTILIPACASSAQHLQWPPLFHQNVLTCLFFFFFFLPHTWGLVGIPHPGIKPKPLLWEHGFLILDHQGIPCSYQFWCCPPYC